MFSINVQKVLSGTISPLAILAVPGVRAHTLAVKEDGTAPAPAAMHVLPVGAFIEDAEDGERLFQAVGHTWLAADGTSHALEVSLLRAIRDLDAGTRMVRAAKAGLTLAWVTLSDKGSRDEREDTSGPAIAAMVADEYELAYTQGYLLPDDGTQLRALVSHLALTDRYDMIITTGGTGVSPRDVTPQSTARLLDFELPGFAQAMMLESLKKTSRAVISRAMAGVIGKSLVLNLPGSLKAVRENLAAVLPALGHTIEKLHGERADCGRQA